MCRCEEISIKLFSFEKISIGLFIFEKGIIESYRFEKNRIEMFSLRRLVLSCFALRRLVLMFNFEKIGIDSSKLNNLKLIPSKLHNSILFISN